MIGENIGVTGDHDLNHREPERRIGLVDNEIILAERANDRFGTLDIVQAIGMTHARVERDHVTLPQKTGLAVGDHAKHECGKQVVGVILASWQPAEIDVVDLDTGAELVGPPALSVLGEYPQQRFLAIK